MVVGLVLVRLKKTICGHVTDFCHTQVEDRNMIWSFDYHSSCKAKGGEMSLCTSLLLILFG